MKLHRLVLTALLGLGLTIATAWLLDGTVSAVAAGTTLIVDTHDDELNDGGGDCSLREAIQAANSGATVDGCTTTGGEHTIELETGVYTLTIPPDGTPDDNADGDLDVSSSYALTITGQGADVTYINADLVDRVFDLHTNHTVVISGATIMGGHVISQDGGIYSKGGGVYNRAADLVLINTFVVGNQVGGDWPAGRGGGMALVGGTTIMRGGGVLSNTSISGAGVYIQTPAMFTMTDGGLIAYNVCSGTGGTNAGGAINVSSGRVTLIDSHVSYNHSGGSGGGIYQSNGTVSLQGTGLVSNTTDQYGGGAYVGATFATLNMTGGRVEGNHADQSGGGLIIWQGRSTLSGAQVVSNTALHGAGVYLTAGTSRYTQTNGTIVAHNRSNGSGGGVYIQRGRMVFDGGTIYSNTANNLGGGVYIAYNVSELEMSGASTISHNYAGSHGGGIFIQQGDAMLNDGSILRNTTNEKGGGVYVQGQDFSGYAGGSFTLNSGEVAYNESRTGGGGVYVATPYGSFEMNGGRIISNTSSNGSGGGVAVGFGTGTVSGGEIAYNSSWAGGGVAVIFSGAFFTQTGASSIAHNTADESGGGVYVSAGEAALLGGEILSNTVTGNYGGGVYVGTGSAELGGADVVSNSSASGGGGLLINGGGATLSGGQISHNSTAGNGGGVYVLGGVFTQTGVSIIAHNDAEVWGGGVNVNFDAMANLNGGQVYSNTCVSGGGGVMVWTDARLNVQGGAIVDNLATGGFGGGGIYNDSGTVDIVSGTVSGNRATAFTAWGGGIFSTGPVTLAHSTLSDNYASGAGGGIFNWWASRLHSEGSAVIGNDAPAGGGIYNLTQATLINTTVSGNHSAGGGGGIQNEAGATMALTYTTVASNTSDSGLDMGGMYVPTGTISLLNTIIANNSPGDCVVTDGETASNGYNLDSDGTCELDAGTDITGTAPLLGPLTAYGDAPLIHPLLSGSQAVDNGFCVPIVTTIDQRGAIRPQGADCDIGAFEADASMIYLPLVLRN